MAYLARVVLYSTVCWCFALSACSNHHAVQEVAPPVSRYLTELRQDVQHEGTRHNRTVACYVDLTRPDNSYRFFVLDLARGSVLLQAMCLNGLTDAQGQVRYSNEVNSNCSSRGLARIGEQYRGSFGRAFRLHGLDAGTSNLQRRAVVLHAWAGVPVAPSVTHPIQSQGCPTLNPQVLDQVAEVIARSPKPLLLRFH